MNLADGPGGGHSTDGGQGQKTGLGTGTRVVGKGVAPEKAGSARMTVS